MSFITIYCNPSLAYIAVIDLQSFQRNASVHSALLAGIFFTTNSSRVLAREGWQTFENSWKKKINEPFGVTTVPEESGCE